MGAVAATEPPNAAVRRIQGGPQRVLVVDMIRQAERDRLLCTLGRRAHKGAKVADRHDGVDRRDHGRRPGKVVGDHPEARVRRGGGAHDQIEIEIAAMFAQPLPAIVAGVVDDDGQSANSRSPEAIERQVDQRAAGDRHHRLAHAVAIGAQARPLPCRDDASLDPTR